MADPSALSFVCRVSPCIGRSTTSHRSFSLSLHLLSLCFPFYHPVPSFPSHSPPFLSPPCLSVSPRLSLRGALLHCTNMSLYSPAFTWMFRWPRDVYNTREHSKTMREYKLGHHHSCQNGKGRDGTLVLVRWLTSTDCEIYVCICISMGKFRITKMCVS